MAERIVITDTDLAPPQLEVTHDDITPPEAKQLDIVWGAPESLDEYGRYPIEDTPRIHEVDLSILNSSGELARKKTRETVFAAHGYQRNSEWVLRDGRKVVDVIEEWNRLRPDYKIDFAAVCNPTEGVAPHLTDVGHISGSDLVISGFLRTGSIPEMHVRSLSPEGVITSPDGRKIVL